MYSSVLFTPAATTPPESTAHPSPAHDCGVTRGPPRRVMFIFTVNLAIPGALRGTTQLGGVALLRLEWSEHALRSPGHSCEARNQIPRLCLPRVMLLLSENFEAFLFSTVPRGPSDSGFATSRVQQLTTHTDPHRKKSQETVRNVPVPRSLPLKTCARPVLRLNFPSSWQLKGLPPSWHSRCQGAALGLSRSSHPRSLVPCLGDPQLLLRRCWAGS